MEKSRVLTQCGRNEGEFKESNLKGMMPMLNWKNEKELGRKEGSLHSLVSTMARYFTHGFL